MSRPNLVAVPQVPPDDGDVGPVLRPRIKICSEAETIRVVTDRINAQVLPNVYVTRGELVELGEVSGDPSTAGDDEAPLPVAPAVVSAAGLASLLAHHTTTYTTRSKGDIEWDEEVTPT